MIPRASKDVNLAANRGIFDFELSEEEMTILNSSFDHHAPHNEL